jgi:hypothetical protein
MFILFPFCVPSGQKTELTFDSKTLPLCYGTQCRAASNTFDDVTFELHAYLLLHHEKSRWSRRERSAERDDRENPKESRPRLGRSRTKSDWRNAEITLQSNPYGEAGQVLLRQGRRRTHRRRLTLFLAQSVVVFFPDSPIPVDDAARAQADIVDSLAGIPERCARGTKG